MTALPVAGLLGAGLLGAGLSAVGTGADGAVWRHLIAHVLPAAALETAFYLAGVGVLALIVGSVTAWLVACHDFPGRRVLGWALLLPMAMPAYIAAYAYLDVLHAAGPAQGALRWAFGVSDPTRAMLPDVRNLPSCVVITGLTLYPYVYLNARIAFAGQAADAIWAARGLGAHGVRLFLRVGLPLARPAIAVGLGLALMEALNDIGASEFLGVRTLTVAIHVTWLTRGSIAGAAGIALVLLVVVLLILTLERWGRRGTLFVGDQRPSDPVSLTGAKAWVAALLCSVPVLAGFAIPASYLAVSAWDRLAARGVPAGLVGWAVNSAWYAGWAAIITVILGISVAFLARRGQVWLLRLGSAGYAMPGAVAAVGLVIALGWVDDALDLVATALTGAVSPVVFLGSGIALVAAYVVRFLAIPAGGLDAAYARLDRDYDDAARGLGCSDHRLLTRVHAPMLRAPLLMAGLLVFVDAVKELPATLLLRPINVETLATTLYGEAVRGTYEDGAVAALALIAIAVLPAAVLAWLQDSRRGVTRLGVPRHRRVAMAQAPAAE